MYINYDSNYNENVLSDSRKWNVYRIAYYKNGSWSSVVNANQHLRSFNLSDNSSDGSNITMGYVCGAKAVLEFKNAPTTLANTLTEGTQIILYLSLKGKENDPDASQLNTVPLVIDEAKVVPIMSGRNITITAYDLSYLMTHEYVSAYESPTALEMVTEIATKYGLTVDGSVSAKIAELGSSLSSMTFNPLSGFTCKQTLGYIAGCFGCNARIGIGRKIYFEWYETSSMPDIGKNIVYLGGSALSEKFVVKLIETGTSENPIVYPNNTSGYSINFENPYITAELARLIYDNKIANNKISFRSGKVKYKGNPINTSGKIVTTTDINNTPVNFYIMKRTLNYDGGLSETIECFGESETTINYKITSPTQQKINRALSRMEDAISKATDVITQTKGSTFELIPIDENDASQGNSGFKIHYQDTGSSAFDDCVIMGTAGGVGLSTNNGETFATAMYFYQDEATGEIHGAINGEVIRAGSISADKIDTSRLIVSKENIDGLDAELAELLEVAESAETKAGNAEATANATSLILGGLTAQENGVTVVKGSTILTGSIGAAQISSGAITAKKIAAGAITADKLTVGDMTNYNRVNPLSYAEWGFAENNGWFIPDEALEYNFLSDWITYQNGLSYRFTGKIRSNAMYQNGYMEFAVGFRIKTTSGAYYASFHPDNVFTANQSKTEHKFDFTWMPKATNVAEIRMAIINMRLVNGQRNSTDPTAGTTDISNVTIRSVGNDAGQIVAGKLVSADGKTYFDLDNSILATSDARINGGSIKIGSETYYTEIALGKITQNLTAGGKVGGLVPTGAGNALRETLYCTSSKEVTISQNNDGGYTDIALFSTNKIVFTVGGEDKVKISSDFTPFSNIQHGTVEGVTSSGEFVPLSGFTSAPTVICTPLQGYAGNSHFIVVNVTSVTSEGFYVKTKDIFGDYGSDVMWVAIG